MVIDPQDKITVKKYTPRLLWYLAFGLLASLLIFVELKYRQTTTVKTLNQLAQKTLVEGSKLLVKTVRLVFHLLGKLLVSFFHFVKNHLKIKQNK
jgi:hypothetical protein